jgi:UDP-N-acetylglucosamine transferase subunit ALG13
MTPPGFGAFEIVTETFNYLYMHKFDRIIVPDAADPTENLSGRLSHEMRFLKAPQKVYYAGVLTSVARMNVVQDVDLFISISGPDPPRAQMEEFILAQVGKLDLPRIVITLGKPEDRGVRQLSDRVTVYGFLDRARQQEMLNRAKMVACRSGYTTMMELAELGRKALIIPTPGQTEQEYLGRYCRERGIFHSVSQYELDLVRDVEIAGRMTGLTFSTDTQANVERLYHDLFAPILE